MGRSYRVGEVATLTRVSVRTLHHYDRIGLLRPAAHSSGGYRMYGESDLLRLQQILTLRYLGFPLKRIGELLGRPDFDLVASLRVQRQALRERSAELERISTAVGDLVERRLETGAWSWELVIEASQAVGASLTQREETMEAHYTPEQMKQFAAVGETTPPEEIASIEREWTELLAEVRANYDLDPASATARALGDRAEALTARTMRGYEPYPELTEAIGANYEKGAFEGNMLAPQAADFAFLARVKAAR
ncbi:MAG: MerR family transcriptional regulator [Chloroflexia bacterium]|nr:MerR family transcriptional regulator [Chloroflexia bacterium]